MTSLKHFEKLYFKSLDMSNVMVAALKSHATGTRHTISKKTAEHQIGKTPLVSEFFPSAASEDQGNTSAARDTSISNSSTLST